MAFMVEIKTGDHIAVTGAASIRLRKKRGKWQLVLLTDGVRITRHRRRRVDKKPPTT